MKILHIGQLIGGLDVYIRDAIIYSSEDKEYVIVHGEDDGSSPVIKNNKQIKEYKVALQRKVSLWHDTRCLFQVKDIIRKEKPDLIHCHSAKGGTIGRIAGCMTRTTTCYTPHAFSFLCTPSKLKKNVYLFIERATRFSTFVMACSESEQRMAVDDVGYSESHALVWHNAVPDPSEERGAKPDVEGNYVCYIGRPCYQKNILFLIDVLSEVKKRGCNIKFVLLGVGYHSPDLQLAKDRIRDLKLEDDILTVPWISHADCQEYIRHSLFYISTSLYEGLPLAVIEAMAHGKAVIASDVTGNRDCVRNGETGFLLPLDTETFARHIVLLANDGELRSSMGQKAREWFKEEFLIDKRIKVLESLYKSLTTVKGGANLNEELRTKNAAGKRVQSQVRLSYAEREQGRPKVNEECRIVEMDAPSERRAA